MIKHTLTKKQQFVLCAMYVESFRSRLPAVQCYDGSVRIFPDGTADCSVYTLCYLQNYGLVGVAQFEFPGWALTPDGEELAKALIKVLA